MYSPHHAPKEPGAGLEEAPPGLVFTTPTTDVCPTHPNGTGLMILLRHTTHPTMPTTHVILIPIPMYHGLPIQFTIFGGISLPQVQGHGISTHSIGTKGSGGNIPLHPTLTPGSPKEAWNTTFIR